MCVDCNCYLNFLKYLTLINAALNRVTYTVAVNNLGCDEYTLTVLQRFNVIAVDRLTRPALARQNLSCALDLKQFALFRFIVPLKYMQTCLTQMCTFEYIHFNNYYYLIVCARL